MNIAKGLKYGCAALALLLCAGEAAAETWKKQGDILLRGRAVGVIPVEEQDVRPVGGNTDISNQVVPELDVTYFFTDHIAAELIAAVTPHDLNHEKSSAGDVDLGEVWLLPPTLTLQYHFDPVTKRKISPYVGAGVNYTTFFDEEFDAPVTRIDYDDSFGLALQAGVDVPVSGNWFVNLDVKKVWIETDVEIDLGATKLDGEVSIDPWIVGAGVGYKF